MLPMQFDTSAYLADTTNLSTIEHGAYCLILMTLWRSKDGWIDGGDVYLSRATRMTLGRWKRLAPTIRALLVADGKGRVSQKRLLKEHRKAQLSAQDRSPGGTPNSEAKSLINKGPILETPKRGVDRPDPALTGKVVGKIEESPKKKNKGSVIPENWTPRPNEREYGRKIGLTEAEIDFGAEQMRRWGIANAHREVARKSNWDMTFRNWLDGMVERQGRGGFNGNHQRVQTTGSGGRGSYSTLAAKLKAGIRDRELRPGEPACGSQPEDRRRDSELGVERVEAGERAADAAPTLDL